MRIRTLSAALAAAVLLLSACSDSGDTPDERSALPQSVPSAGATSGDPSPTAPMDVEGGRFVGSITDDSGASVIMSSVELDAGDDLTGSLQHVVESDTAECTSILVTAPVGEVAALDPGTYAGTVAGRTHSMSTACPSDGDMAGPPNSISAGRLTATISGDTLSGIWSDGTETLSFTATRAS